MDGLFADHPSDKYPDDLTGCLCPEEVRAFIFVLSISDQSIGIILLQICASTLADFCGLVII